MGSAALRHQITLVLPLSLMTGVLLWRSVWQQLLSGNAGEAASGLCPPDQVSPDPCYSRL